MRSLNESESLRPMNRVDPAFLQQRRDTIREGVDKAICREVRRLHEQGLPVYVAENGKVVVRPAPPSGQQANQ
ncbi:MAG: hypothetical protein JXA69_14120 [Phycisphaerae bacterium]|nr:hypothetical protein [Phycisphaerae bacterium]